MHLRKLLQTSLTLAGLSLVAPQLSAISPFISPAAAAVGIEIGTNEFYDELSPYGDWVWYRGGYVFVPGDVDDRWRPYAYGRWAYTQEYGWLWISDEPFGWATYHYGRWGYGDDLGWYWVPGRVWAPAWVSWRRGPDYVVWAPLPPTYGDDYYDGEDDEDYEIADNDIPDNYWNAVPAVSFLAANLAAYVFADDDRDYGYHHHRYIEETEPLGPVRYRNNMIMNNGLDAGFIEKETNQKVRRYKVRETDDFRRAGKRNGDEIEVFDRKVKPRPDAKPMKVKNIEDVEQKHGKRWKGANGNNQDSVSKNKAGAGTPEFGNGQDQPGTGEKLTKKQRREAEKQKKKQRNQGLSNDNQTGATERQDSENVGQSGKKKKRNQGYSNQGQPGSMDNQGGEYSNQGKKKKRNQGSSNQDQLGVMDSQGGEGSNQGKKKKRNQASEFSNDGQNQNRNANSGESEGGGKKKKRYDSGNEGQGQSGNQSGTNKKRKPNAGCDPDTGANC
ncbi:MAG: DUF6600 domain-containing protein [Hyphomicrobiales bacterium]